MQTPVETSTVKEINISCKKDKMPEAQWKTCVAGKYLTCVGGVYEGGLVVPSDGTYQ